MVEKVLGTSLGVANMPYISIIDAFEGLPDPRLDRTKLHKLSDILVITLCGAICGVDNWVEMEHFGKAKLKWFRTFLDLPNGIPSHDTLGRVFAMLDPDVFRRCFITWVEGLALVDVGDVIAVDGKTVRRSLDAANGGAPLHLVNAWASEAGIAMGQLATEKKSNEIKAIPALLNMLRVKGCIVTTDAMGCQKEIARTIVDRGADYALQLKDNHPSVRQDVDDYFGSEIGTSLLKTDATFHETTDGDHGRIEIRRYWLTTDISWFEDAPKWAKLGAFGMVESERSVGDGEPTLHRRYYLTTLTQVSDFARAVRSHWSVENSLHWVLDMAFDEDHSRARAHNAAENLAIMRQVALNLLKQEKVVKVGIKTKRKKCGWDHDYLLGVLRLRNVPPK